MATSGAFGFHANGQDLVTYNHYDSDPPSLGKAILETLKLVSDEDLKGAASRITLVNQNQSVPPELLERYMVWSDLAVGNQEGEDWYSLLRKAQGNLSAYIHNLEHMIDDRSFLGDSLYCEWAYIVNLDTGCLEIYKGLNEDPLAAGRYADCPPKEHGYFGVRLLGELPLGMIRGMSDEAIQESMERIQGEGGEGDPVDLSLVVAEAQRATGVETQASALQMIKGYFGEG